MYKALENLYKRGRIDKKGVAEAVEKGMITPAQYKEITGEDYPAA